MNAADATNREEPFLRKLEAAKVMEKEAARLRRQETISAAIDAYDRAKELYEDSGFAYQRDHELSDEVQRALNRCSTILENLRHPKQVPARIPATTQRPNCLYCNKPLRRYSRDGETFRGDPCEWGTYGDNRFCGKTCGWRWACKHAPPVPKGKK